MSMKKRFADYRRYALVTGAASGMGRIYARRLALMGYNVVIVDINGDGLDQTEELVRKDVMASDGIGEEMKADFDFLFEEKVQATVSKNDDSKSDDLNTSVDNAQSSESVGTNEQVKENVVVTSDDVDEKKAE